MELVKIESNKDYGLVVSSRIIAERLGKRHSDVLRDIGNILANKSTQICGDLAKSIFPSQYKDSKNRSYKEYLLTKDGFTLYMFNIQGYVDFKMAYINRFNEMERALKEPQLQLPEEPKALPKPKELIFKTYRGVPVMTIADLSILAGVCETVVRDRIADYKIAGTRLNGVELRRYKQENGLESDTFASQTIFYKDAVMDFCSFSPNTSMVKAVAYFNRVEQTQIPDPKEREYVLEHKRIAITQAELLVKLGNETPDPYHKAMMHLRATDILMSVGVYDGNNGATSNWNPIYDHGYASEGWTKRLWMQNAQALIRSGIDQTIEILKNCDDLVLG